MIAPRQLTDEARHTVTPWQLVTVLYCVAIYIADGLDIAVTAYAAPALMKDWSLSPKTMGLILSAGSLGLVVGASLIALLADRFGRRAVILISVMEVSVMLIMLSTVHSVGWLLGLRFIASVGIGALVPTLNVMLLEYGRGRAGNVFLSVGHVGYAIGAVVGAIVGAALIGPYGWRALFLFSGILTAVIGALGWFLLPESLSFLLMRQPRGALARANRILGGLGEPPLESLPSRPPQTQQSLQTYRILFTKDLVKPTLLLWLASVAYYFTFYFFASWTPQVLVTAGLSSQAAIGSGVITGVGAAIGAVGAGILSLRFNSRRLTAASFAITATGLVLFAISGSHAALLLSAAGATSVAVQAIYTGLVIVAAELYPVQARTTGVGFMIGIGRLGAIVGPYAGGALMALDWGRLSYYSVFAASCLIGAVAVLKGRPEPAREVLT